MLPKLYFCKGIEHENSPPQADFGGILDTKNISLLRNRALQKSKIPKFSHKIVELSENERNLLFFLVKNINHVLSSNIIIDYIWQEKVVSDNTLRTLIKKLRSKISYDFIKNIRGSGYKIEKYDKH